MKRLFLILCSILKLSFAQLDFELPKEAKPFVLKGYEVYDYIKGDLNADGRQDAILVLKYILQEKDSLLDDERIFIYPVLILLRNQQLKLELKFRSDSLLTNMNSPKYYAFIEIDTVQKNSFTVAVAGGRRYKWNFSTKFIYNSLKKDFYLKSIKHSSFNAIEEQIEKDEIYEINEDELPVVSFKNYVEDKEYYETYSEAIVKVDKTFFYTNPDLNSKPRKGFLMKNDKVNVGIQTNNFIHVYFTNKNNKTTTGFILKKDMLLIK